MDLLLSKKVQVRKLFIIIIIIFLLYIHTQVNISLCGHEFIVLGSDKFSTDFSLKDTLDMFLSQ